MAHAQVVRKTHCEQTTGYPKLLRSMVDYVGFSYLPEYQVSEIPRDYGQTFYRATVWISGDDGDTAHKHVAEASTVDMAVHLAAYDAALALRREYYCFNDHPFCYVPYYPYTDSQYELVALDMTAQFGQSSDSVAGTLRLEVAALRQQLHRALSHLGQYDRRNVTPDAFPRFQLAFPSRLSAVGGYTPERGPLITTDPDHVGPLLYGTQTPDAYSVQLRRIVRDHCLYCDRRYTHRSSLVSSSEGSES